MPPNSTSRVRRQQIADHLGPEHDGGGRLLGGLREDGVAGRERRRDAPDRAVGERADEAADPRAEAELLVDFLRERIAEATFELSRTWKIPAPDNDEQLNLGTAALEAFLARVPMIFSVVVLSPHGWFGQANVLGRPDTGGQVVYILDQVRALEEEMRQRLLAQGLDLEPQIVILTRLIPEAEDTSCAADPVARRTLTSHVTPCREA